MKPTYVDFALLSTASLKLPPSTFRVYAAVAMYVRKSNGLTTVSLSEIASHYGISKVAVHKHIKLLEDAGLLNVSRSEGMTNSYELLYPDMNGTIPPAVRIPHRVIQLTTPRELTIYAALAAHANGGGICWPSQQRIAEIIGRSRQTVSKYVRRLADKYLVRITKPRGKALRTNSYHLPDITALNNSPLTREQVIAASLRVGATVNLIGGGTVNQIGSGTVNLIGSAEQNIEQNNEQNNRTGLLRNPVHDGFANASPSCFAQRIIEGEEDNTTSTPPFKENAETWSVSSMYDSSDDDGGDLNRMGTVNLIGSVDDEHGEGSVLGWSEEERKARLEQAIREAPEREARFARRAIEEVMRERMGGVGHARDSGDGSVDGIDNNGSAGHAWWHPEYDAGGVQEERICAGCGAVLPEDCMFICHECQKKEKEHAAAYRREHGERRHIDPILTEVMCYCFKVYDLRKADRGTWARAGAIVKLLRSEYPNEEPEAMYRFYKWYMRKYGKNTAMPRDPNKFLSHYRQFKEDEGSIEDFYRDWQAAIRQARGE